jgi:hypothetical protein
MRPDPRGLLVTADAPNGPIRPGHSQLPDAAGLDSRLWIKRFSDPITPGVMAPQELP